MSADLPKPVAYWNEEYASIFTPSYVAEHRQHIEPRIKSGELKPIFTELELREYAEAKCAELRAAADGLVASLHAILASDGSNGTFDAFALADARRMARAAIIAAYEAALEPRL